MKLKEILEELDKKETKWEKRVFIQLILERETDPEITEKLSKIKKILEQRSQALEPLKIPDAPELQEAKEPELEQMVESAPETEQGEAYTPLTPSIKGISMEEEYRPLQTEDEVAQEYQGHEQYEYEQEPMTRGLIDFVDWDLGGKVFNKEGDELITEDLDKKIKEDAYKRRADHG